MQRRLRPEGSPDVGRDHGHVRLGQPEDAREIAAGAERRLGGQMQREPAAGGLGQGGARLERRRSHPRARDRHLDRHGGRCEGRIWVAARKREARGLRRLACARLSLLDGNTDRRSAVLRRSGAGRGDRRDGLADRLHAALRQRREGRGAHSGDDLVDRRTAEPRQIRARDHRDDPRNRARRIDVDGGDAARCGFAAHEGEVQAVLGSDVVDEASCAAEQPVVFAPLR